jgi:tetratricopeptide (TPR) repeat protein
MRGLSLVGVALTASLLEGCASTPIKKPDLAALARADALVLDGCYDCLLDARSIYERVAVGKARPLVVTRLFETDLLIALREKELAIDATASLERAQDLAKELPPAAEAGRILSLVDLVPNDNVGTPRRETAAAHETRSKLVPAINGELAWLRSSTELSEPVRQYLSLAVDCGYLARPGRPPAAAKGAPPDFWNGSSAARDVPADVPLVAYRVGMCDSVSMPTLQRVRDAVPKFAEGAFFLARPEVADAPNTGGRHARELLTEAHARFPNSPSVAYLFGNFFQISGDCRQALQFYDETLQLKPLHEDALLGRTMCLSYLQRADEAIASATHMIEIETDNRAQAYYWRAWNHHLRHTLDLARADIDRAKALGATAAVYTLAGIIEHDQDDLGPAESDLTRAKTLGRLNCTAMWYLGLVKIKQERWLDSAGHFENAMKCYDTNVKDDAAALAAMRARTDLDADFQASQIASFEAALKTDHSQYCAAAFNAANQYAHGGSADRARPLVEIAAGDPALADMVSQLREILKGAS